MKHFPVYSHLCTTIKAKTETSGSNSSNSGTVSSIISNIKKSFGNSSGSTGAYGGVFSGGKTLVGELGPELRVSNGKYSIVGANGAEFINLKKNDIIFSTEQTAGLFNGRSGIRGTAMAYGNAFANGTSSSIDAAIAALKNERNLWQSILTSVPDMLKKAGSGSGGGGGGSNKEYLMELERWFNWLRQIEQLENKITILRAKRENMKNGKIYAESLYEENALLKKQYDITKDLLENQIKYRNLKIDY